VKAVLQSETHDAHCDRAMPKERMAPPRSFAPEQLAMDRLSAPIQLPADGCLKGGFANMQRGIDSILLPEIITPSQYYDSIRQGKADSPMQRLMLAVLMDAIRSFQKYAGAGSHKGKRLFAEIEEWLFGDGGEGPFSFESVCDMLEIDPRALRSGLKHLLDQRLSEAPSRRMGRRSPVWHSSKISIRLERFSL